MDDYSRAVCGHMVFTGAPLSHQPLALQQAIWRETDLGWAMSEIILPGAVDAPVTSRAWCRRAIG